MIELVNVTKTYTHHGDTKDVLRDVSFSFKRGQSIGILGANGSGKSTLLRMISGTELPTSGKIIRNARLSWRLGLQGGFHGSLTGEENTKFVSRIYGGNHCEVLDYVESFAELGDDFYRPVNTYSSGMRARLAFGLSLALSFEVYLIDETTAVGDARFRMRCRQEMTKRLTDADVIMVSHSASTLREYCTHATILHNGKLSEIYPLREAMKHYKRILEV